ncbi:hypothetical protein PENTCL1PPCAC_22213, partial [Pristionchus entomophagus]
QSTSITRWLHWWARFSMENVPMPPMPLHSLNGANRNPFDMKRPGMDDYKDFPKRQKNLSGDGYADALAQGKFEMRLLVGSKSAGAVIGKGGDNIKRLRSQFDASVSVPDSSAPSGILTMVSTIDNLADMVKDILPDSRRQHGGSGGDNPKIEVRMIVHQSHAGALIGRAGTKIKELREATRANIKVFSHCAPNSTDRVVLIGGEDNAISDACKTIMETVRDIPVKGHTKQYDTLNYDPTYINEYGGFAPMGGAPFRGPPMGGNGGPPGGPGMFPPNGGTWWWSQWRWTDGRRSTHGWWTLPALQQLPPDGRKLWRRTTRPDYHSSDYPLRTRRNHHWSWRRAHQPHS